MSAAFGVVLPPQVRLAMHAVAAGASTLQGIQAWASADGRPAMVGLESVSSRALDHGLTVLLHAGFVTYGRPRSDDGELRAEWTWETTAAGRRAVGDVSLGSWPGAVLLTRPAPDAPLEAVDPSIERIRPEDIAERPEVYRWYAPLPVLEINSDAQEG